MRSKLNVSGYATPPCRLPHKGLAAPPWPNQVAQPQSSREISTVSGQQEVGADQLLLHACLPLVRQLHQLRIDPPIDYPTILSPTGWFLGASSAAREYTFLLIVLQLFDQTFFFFYGYKTMGGALHGSRCHSYAYNISNGGPAIHLPTETYGGVLLFKQLLASR